ncbi:MAG: NAD(+) kinase [Methylococcaceae bacterium]|nr:NAD(+) kinase [Methylococcaceae bacterium]
MEPTFHRIALIGKPDSERIAQTLPPLYQHLVKRGKEVLVERSCARFIDGSPPAFALNDLGQHCDLAIVIGGDGTLLTAARVLAEQDIPLIGVNLGRLGFLVDISPQLALSTLDAILEGRYRAEERRMLRAVILRDGETVAEQTAVNEVVIHSWNSTSMIEIITFIDGVFLNSQRSDGLIISTPTGSTAYALSGGGPILYPTLQAIELVPINPHSLTNRPIVISDDSIVEIAFRYSKDFRARLACDNVSIPDIAIGDRICIAKSPRPFRILHPVGHDFFEILRVKLNWSGGYQA